MLVTQASAGDKFVAPSGFAAWIANAFIGTTSGIRIAGSSGGTTGTSTNLTTGVAANGTPKFSLSGCSNVVVPGFYTRCGVNAIANFTNLSMVDAVDGKTCTATYNNGTLTVTKGALTVSGLLNGQGIDHVSTYGSGSTEVVASVGAMTVTSSNSSSSNLQWNEAGVLKSITGTIASVASVQDFSCAQR
jgi:hypothetical protein